MSSQTVFSKGVFHGLPEFPEHNGKSYTAIVAGANGITGSSLIRVLNESPSRWTKIFALSRKPPQSQLPSNVEHIAIDLLEDPSIVTQKLREKGVKADYAFFAAYIQPPPKADGGLWSDVEETERVNVLLLKNFLDALEISESIPKRFLLQTGGKHYGLHLGPPLTPLEESDPRYTKERNFYFAQEDLLWKWCETHKVEWNVTRPGYILGAVKEAAMNIVYGLALYAAIQKELGQPLKFPGGAGAWDAEKHLSSATLIGYHAEWAVLTDGAKNQILNIGDSSLFTYGKFWPVLASWYGIEYDVPEQDPTKYQEVTMTHTPPPRGFGGPGVINFAWSLEGWASQPEVREAWGRVKTRYGLIATHDPFENPKDVFGLLDTDLLGSWGRSLSMGKNRKLGWHGYVDTHDAIFDTISELANMKMVPLPSGPREAPIHYRGY